MTCSHGLRRICLGATIFFVCLAVLGSAGADPVSPERARRVASSWMLLKTGTPHQAVASVALAVTEQAKKGPLHYIFNMDPEGWVIVSGDDEAHPIIAFSLEGSADPADPPPAFLAWMMGVDQAIAGLRDQKIESSSGSQPGVAKAIESSWSGLEKLTVEGASVGAESEGTADLGDVGPLVQTTWSQETYYNAMCPADAAGPDGHALVGCGATAMGQIMRYHRSPETGYGSHAYTHAVYGTLSADFGATTYDWANMPTGSLSGYNDAVATLLYHAGVAVDMNYGPQASGCSPLKSGAALRDYFRYGADDIVARANYSSSEWMQQLRADLESARPVLYAGYGTGGHAFVCDGYQGDYFHFNWGWNGAYDGYYYLDDLTPGSANFNDEQMAVFNIRPGESDGNDSLAEVVGKLFEANIYDAIASYYNWIALYSGGYETFRYNAYLYAAYAFNSMADAFLSAPGGTYTQSAAYNAYLSAYYRYVYSVYYYAYGDPVYAGYVNESDFYGDVHRAYTGAYAASGI